MTLRLEGTASNRDAVGARVTVTAGDRARVAWRLGGGSYQAAGDPRLHFGLGDADRVESIEIRWPSGRIDRLGPLQANAGYLIREGATGRASPRLPAPAPDGGGLPGRRLSPFGSASPGLDAMEPNRS